MFNSENNIRNPMRLYNYRKAIRVRVKDIVIVTIPSLINRQKFEIDPNLLYKNKYFTWNIFENYFKLDLQMDDIPVHYAMEKVGKDWVILNGCPTITKSIFLEELSKFNIIHPLFENSLCICIVDDFSMNIPELRMWKMLCHRILSGFLAEKRLSKASIHFIDEIVNWEAYKAAWETGKFFNQINPSTFYERQILEMELTTYKKEMV